RGLVSPVDLHGHEVIRSEHHFRMVLYDGHCVIAIVLTVDRKKNPSFAVELEHSLKLLVGVTRVTAAQFDVRDPLLPRQTSPKRVIQIQDYDLPIAFRERLDEPEVLACE